MAMAEAADKADISVRLIWSVGRTPATGGAGGLT
jgi:hypothetical protein